LNSGIDFFQSFRGDIFVESAEDGLAFVGCEVFDNIGDVGGMELGQPVVRNLQLDAASGIGLDEIDESPGDGARGDFLDQKVQGGAGRESAQKAAYRATGADIDGSDAQGGVKISGLGDGIDLEIDIVDADDFAAVDIDDLLIEQIAIEEE